MPYHPYVYYNYYSPFGRRFHPNVQQPTVLLDTRPTEQLGVRRPLPARTGTPNPLRNPSPTKYINKLENTPWLRSESHTFSFYF